MGIEDLRTLLSFWLGERWGVSVPSIPHLKPEFERRSFAHHVFRPVLPSRPGVALQSRLGHSKWTGVTIGVAVEMYLS